MSVGVTQTATQTDFDVCRRLHRQYGTTYYWASRRFPETVRRQVDAVYGFVRVPDEWVDNPGELSPAERLGLIDDFRSQLDRSARGERVEHPVMRAFGDVLRATAIPLEEPHCFLDAMAADVTVDRYPTYADLEGYMRGSAVAVGLMMCRVTGAPETPAVRLQATALGEAMQMTNFMRDVGEDLRRGRVYLPLEDLDRFGVTEGDLRTGRVTPPFEELMRFEIARTRALYAASDPGIAVLPARMRPAVKTARILYSRILDRIEASGYDVFVRRARTSPLEKLAVSARCLLFA